MALDFFAGCLGGCAGVLVGHPFDTVKVHMQTQNHLQPIYRNTLHCLTTIAKQESVRGLYRGMTSPMAGVAVVNAIVFGVYGNIQRNTANPDSLRSHFLAGTTAGLVQSLVCSPMELIKTRLQLQHTIPNAKQFKSPFQCLLHIRRREGLRGVFRGLGITAMRDMPGFSSYFVSYELMTRSTPDPSAVHTLMAGGLAGTFSWLVTFPVDVIKSRLQADGMTGTRQYAGIWDCARKGYREEGIKFYSRGLTSTLMRAFPMNAACFLVVSSVMKMSQTDITIGMDYHQPEPMAIIGSMAAPLAMPTLRHRDHHSERHKSDTIRHFVFSSTAFHEAVCQDELAELAHEIYDKSDYYGCDIVNGVVATAAACNEEEATEKTRGEIKFRLLTD